MRIVASLLTAACFIAAAEASTTGVAPPQSQAAPSAPEPSTVDIISRRCFVKSSQATARPRVSGSAAGSSATPIASNVIVLLPTPSAAKALPWETLGGYLFFAYGSDPSVRLDHGLPCCRAPTCRPSRESCSY
jgi:hypothetical protein